ncbi:metal-dependent phosphohydrolase [Streptomyces sp. GMY02]|uniref:inositol oxygenase family protein n=1 Tax=Streptomyces sp. GMY02 TaxID=1333528 RepID=UPI001C2BC25B|nr:inositol oxygenase family protein [Streptomyces sp. GMY02]QXE33458.1 metal-dependent phosphohydrolase [Streptomyces sp. GMY02]
MAANSVDELMDLLHACRGVRDFPGGGADSVDLHEHALQTAALLRRRHPADKELQIAGLVHDLGHLLLPGDDVGHAGRAADAVRPLLGHRVARLVQLHVPAKRYLAAMEPWHTLPEHSARTLLRQGGPMTRAEAEAFALDPMAEDAVRLRRADEEGRAVGLDAGILDDWRPVLESVAAGHHHVGARSLY